MSDSLPKSRNQKDLAAAHQRIVAVRANQGIAPEVRDRFAALCLSFPMLVLRDGLCQSISFYEARGSGKRNPNPHGLILQHVREILAVDPTGDLSAYLAGLDIGGYFYSTNRLLDAWVYQKRFAESLLGADPTQDGGE